MFWTFSSDLKSRCWHFWQELSLCLCPFLRLVYWAVWQWMLLLLIGQLWVICLRLFEPRIFLVGWAHWCGRFFKVVLWGADVWAVGIPYCLQGKRGRENWAFWSTTFLLEVCQFQFTTSFSKIVGMFCFHQTVTGLSHSHTGWVSSLFLSTPTRQRWNIPSIYLATVLSEGGAMCPPAVQDYVVPSKADYVLCSPGGVAVSLSTGRRYRQAPCPLIMVDPHPRCL
jgi:hypothetical protein